mmetsp:Transcript_33539/g.83576  ORF Transcript_33539/g.83576 Transcript_33539/m.83576 type:complete len:313 (-) Transcript_33539:215-1153(-)
MPPLAPPVGSARASHSAASAASGKSGMSRVASAATGRGVVASAACARSPARASAASAAASLASSAHGESSATPSAIVPQEYRSSASTVDLSDAPTLAPSTAAKAAEPMRWTGPLVARRKPRGESNETRSCASHQICASAAPSESSEPEPACASKLISVSHEQLTPSSAPPTCPPSDRSSARTSHAPVAACPSSEGARARETRIAGRSLCPSISISSSSHTNTCGTSVGDQLFAAWSSSAAALLGWRAKKRLSTRALAGEMARRRAAAVKAIFPSSAQAPASSASAANASSARRQQPTMSFLLDDSPLPPRCA